MGMDLTGLGSVADLASSVINKIWPDKTQAEKDQMAIALATMQNEITLMQSQTDINKIEAANTSLFVSGWRPFIGWSCGVACVWNWMGLPIAQTIAEFFHHAITVKPADLSEMTPILIGMLGLGAYRTVEKIRGVAAK